MEFKHPYIPITKETESEMLKSIGKKDLGDLFCNIPEEFRMKEDLNIPESHTEFEVRSRIRELAEKNNSAENGRVFLGGSLGTHYIPALVPSLAGRSEFLTAYTSYQPEVSQGMLQTLFEYQSLLAELLEMDVVNSSMYDMATGLGEAARMAVRVKKRRNRFLIPSTINPEHYEVLYTYTEPAEIEIERIDFDQKTGLMSISDLKSKLDENVAGVYIENPSSLGFIETQVDEISKLVHDAGALLVTGVDVLSMGILRPPGDYGTDIVIAEGQNLGSPVSFGGPLLGIFGCTMDRKLVYQLPGRLVGMTRTIEEPYERGFVLTLSPREQHIRREKATSNICSNQALAAVTATVYMSVLGSSGIIELGKAIAYKSNYAAKKLNEIPGVAAPAVGDSIWKQFVVKFENGESAQSVHESLLERDFQGGIILTNEFPWLGESMLLSVTEMHNMEVIDELVESVRQAVSNGGAK
ncbi:MAG: aminomethyl-transferring glycine dehydrogenase subunit GcvPA [Candidatus Thorarchaeota archaeon]